MLIIGWLYHLIVTKSEIHALQPTTKDTDGECRKLYLTNKQILAIMILGMISSHGPVVIQKMVSMDFLQGKA